MSEARPVKTHPIVYLLLCVPFGATGGYVTVTLAFLLSHAGVSVAGVAGLIAISLLPQTWKVLWAPIVDTTLNSKTWYLIAAFVTGLSLIAIAFVPATAAALATTTALVFTNSVAVSFLAMAAENLMAHSTSREEKGRAGGWYQAGNLGGTGIGGGAALWIAQHSHLTWLPATTLGALCLVCCAALLFVAEPKQDHRKLNYLKSLWEVAKDVWNTAKARAGFLALLICFLPIGSGAASGLWAAVAGDWHASADTVALVNGAMGGVVSAVGCVIGGYLCDRMDRKFAYALFGALLSAVAIFMAIAARSTAMFITFTLLYAFVQGFNYAAFSAVVLEAIGRGAAATKYNLFASLSNMPIAYLVLIDGWAQTKWNSGAMLWTEALIGFVAIGVFAAISLATRPRTTAPA